MDLKDIKASVNEVLLSDTLREGLEVAPPESKAYEQYYTLLKSYQKTVCLLNPDLVSSFT